MKSHGFASGCYMVEAHFHLLGLDSSLPTEEKVLQNLKHHSIAKPDVFEGETFSFLLICLQKTPSKRDPGVDPISRCKVSGFQIFPSPFCPLFSLRENAQNGSLVRLHRKSHVACGQRRRRMHLLSQQQEGLPCNVYRI